MEYDAVYTLRDLTVSEAPAAAPDVSPYALGVSRPGTIGASSLQASPIARHTRLPYLRPTLFQKVSGPSPDG